MANFDPKPFWEIALDVKWFWRRILISIENYLETNLSKVIQKILVLDLSIPKVFSECSAVLY